MLIQFALSRYVKLFMSLKTKAITKLVIENMNA